MKETGSETIHRIEQLLTSKKKKAAKDEKHTPMKSTQKRSPHRVSLSPNKFAHTLYQPLQKDNAMIDRQLRQFNKEIEHQQCKIQNKHSYFLNAKNPKAPLYLRAQDIAREKQLKLAQKRQQQQREKEDKQQQEYLQFLAIEAEKRKVTKYQAYEITDRLYKEHYNKATRLNEKKMGRLREQAKVYRNKPQISTNTKQIYKVVADKHELQKDVLERFKQYQDYKVHRQSQFQKEYRGKYFPFKPTISDTSRMIVQRYEPSRLFNRSTHSKSCTVIKKTPSTNRLLRSEYKDISYEQFEKEYPMAVSRFELNQS